MTLMAYDGSTVYVWNPYSLAELKGMLAAPTSSGRSVLDEYLYCVATGSSDTCTPPSTSVFDSQQVQCMVDELPYRYPCSSEIRSQLVFCWFFIRFCLFFLWGVVTYYIDHII